MNTKTLGIIFADIDDGKLPELTSKRPTASIPFGGRYRLIDFILSNFHHADITDVGVIVQSNYRSLMDHLGSGKDWDLSRKHGGLSILPPLAGQRMYHTALEALCSARHYLEANPCPYVILADSANLYSADLEALITRHIETGADVTAACVKETVTTGGNETLYAYLADADGRVTAIDTDPEPGEHLMDMGLMIWKSGTLLRAVGEATSFGLSDLFRDVLQKRTNACRMFIWPFDGYVARVDSLQSYLKANMDLLDPDVRDDLFHRYGPVCTRVRDEVPAQYGESACVHNSFIADGCVIEGNVENSILFRGVTVGSGATVSNSIILKNSHVGRNVTMGYGIIDKQAQIGDGRSLMGYDTYPLFIRAGSIV